MHSSAPPIPRRVMLAIFMGGLLLLGFQVLQPFLVPVAWAGILVYVTWPLYLRLRARMGGRHTISALLMTLLLALILILPLVWVMLLLRSEMGGAYARLETHLSSGHLALPPELRNLPWLGEEIQALFDRLNSDPGAFKEEVQRWSEWLANHAGGVVGGVGRNLAKLGLAIFTAFFFYRDGEAVITQIREVLRQILDERVDEYLEAIGATARAVVYGIGLTALAQGLLAGMGYWVAGVQSPVFFGAVTTLVALIPFGTPFAWGSISIWLFLDGHTWPAIGLALWGTLVVSWVDNIIRPLVISSATRIPFLLVMFGVLGGLAAFGMIGLFIGPVILAVLLAVWREWLEHAGMKTSTDNVSAQSQTEQ
jgi:predicted PurR-regulated permease PerM